MAEQENTEEKKPAGKSGMIMMVVVGALAVGGGVATPLVLAQLNGADPGTKVAVTKTSGIAIPEPTEKTTFIDFDEVTVNLDESRFNRYLALSISLEVAEVQKLAIEKLIDEKKAVLNNWLIIHLADKSLEDVRGKFGHNRLRREIHDFFNMTLFDDGIERIQDVLLKKINIQ